MRYENLGRSGLRVSEICLGTMTFHGGSGMFRQIGQVDQAGADDLVRTAIEAGVNFIDTADVYSEGQSEVMTGQALRNLGVPRDEVVVATKAFNPMGEGANQRGASRYHLLNACQASLERLGLDHIDLYQLHGFDHRTPLEEQFEALDILVRHGHVRYVGVSNYAAWQLLKAVGVTEMRRLAPIVSLQAYYTLAGRDLEREVIPALIDQGIGLMVWSPLAGGYLSGKFTGAEGEGRRADFDFPPIDRARADACVEAMRPIAEAHDCSVARVAQAWLLHRPGVTSVIVGARRVDQLRDNIAAAELSLSEDERARLDEASRLPAEYPGWMLERMAGRLEG